MFGLSPVYQLLLGDGMSGTFFPLRRRSGRSLPTPPLNFALALTRHLLAANNMAAMNPMMAAAPAAGGASGAGAAAGPAPPPQMPGAPGPDYLKMFRAERENLDIVEYSWAADGVEDRLLERFGSTS